MTGPESTEPVAATDTPIADAVAADSASTEPPADETETPEEAASDAALRSWAKDNGIEGVPASGRLSATWRDQITAAMAAALDPKEEASAEATSSESSTSSDTTKTDPEEPTQEDGSTEAPVAEPAPVQPEFETGEYRSVFRAPETWVHSQTYTA